MRTETAIKLDDLLALVALAVDPRGGDGYPPGETCGFDQLCGIVQFSFGSGVGPHGFD